MNYLFDTDTLIHLWRGQALVRDRLAAQPVSAVSISIITMIEVLRGRFDAMLKAATGPEVCRAQDRLIETQDALRELTVIPFREEASKIFEHLRNQRSLNKIGRADLLIASIALGEDAVLITRNVRHFQQVPRLRIENWVD